jgi:hypothetical protein
MGARPQQIGFGNTQSLKQTGFCVDAMLKLCMWVNSLPQNVVQKECVVRNNSCLHFTFISLYR